MKELERLVNLRNIEFGDRGYHIGICLYSKKMFGLYILYNGGMLGNMIFYKDTVDMAKMVLDNYKFDFKLGKKK